MPKAKVTSKGQVTIPSSIRKATGIENGDELIFEPLKEGNILIRVQKKARLMDLYGSLPATKPYPGTAEIRQEIKNKIAEKNTGTNYD
ncbi:MAG: AbrB/MazE/SpoVT family DNA-binding domain-containing protein [Bacillota bacterium]|nr:AbrB/MazE/SpoVT family DNA-binding domain-containing protein [Bacillota bacterium]